MTIAAGSTILASDVQAIKDDIDAVISASGEDVSTSESTTSTSYTDLTTPGPAVTITTGTSALVIVTGNVSNNTAGQRCYISFAVSGSSTVSADDANALIYESSNGGDGLQASFAMILTGLTAGSNTFTAKYKVTGGTGSFARRRIQVVPLGD